MKNVKYVIFRFSFLVLRLATKGAITMSGGHGGGHEVEKLIPEIEAWEESKKILKKFWEDGLFGVFFIALDLLLGKESRSSDGGGHH